MNTGTNEANPATLADIIRARRVRKGKADGIDANGAWWWAWPKQDPRICAHGGDGIGQSDARTITTLRARHYRCGRVTVGAWSESWHQNTGERVRWVQIGGLATATTAEDVIATLARAGDDCWRACHRPAVEAWAAEIGLSPAPAAPDEASEGVEEGASTS